MSKKWKILFAYGSVIILLLTFLFYVSYRYFLNEQIQLLTKHTELLAYQLESADFDPVTDKDKKLFLIKSSSLFPKKKLIALFNKSGQIQLSNIESFINKDIRTHFDIDPSTLISQTQIEFQRIEDDTFVHLTKVRMSDSDFVLVSYEIGHILKKLRLNFFSALIISFSLIVASIILLSITLDKYFVTPLKTLVDGIQSNSLDDEAISKLHKLDSDVGKIAVATKRLLSKNQTLESKVNKESILILQDQKLLLLGQTAASIAHEVKNPLAFIYMLCDSVISSGGNGLDLNDCQRIKDSADRAGNLLKELLQFSRLEDTSKSIDLHQLLNNIVNVNRILIKDRGHILNLELEASHFKILGNPIKLQQIFTNLIFNASEAIPLGQRGIIDIRTFDYSEKVIVSVSDNGTGIAEMNQNKIFQNFFTTKEGKKGTGLGLGVVKQLINEMQADIWFETEVGKGTTFYTSIKVIND